MKYDICHYLANERRIDVDATVNVNKITGIIVIFKNCYKENKKISKSIDALKNAMFKYIYPCLPYREVGELIELYSGKKYTV